LYFFKLYVFAVVGHRSYQNMETELKIYFSLEDHILFKVI